MARSAERIDEIEERVSQLEGALELAHDRRRATEMMLLAMLMLFDEQDRETVRKVLSAQRRSASMGSEHFLANALSELLRSVDATFSTSSAN